MTYLFQVVCTCALGTTGIGVGVFGCYDIDGCVLEPCWEDLAGLGVEAECENVIANVNMTDPFEASFHLMNEPEWLVSQRTK